MEHHEQLAHRPQGTHEWAEPARTVGARGRGARACTHGDREAEGVLQTGIWQFYVYRKIYFISNVDLFIAGSDQIWNTNMENGNNGAYFLDFGSSAIKKISYAASFGIKNIEKEINIYNFEYYFNYNLYIFLMFLKTFFIIINILRWCLDFSYISIT